MGGNGGLFFLAGKFIIAISFWHALTLYTLSYSVEKLLFDTKKILQKMIDKAILSLTLQKSLLQFILFAKVESLIMLYDMFR